MSVVSIATKGLQKFPLLLLTVSVSLNVALAAKIQGDRTSAKSAKTLGQLPRGAHVSSLDLKRSTGEPVKIAYADAAAPTVLYVMRPGCGWCKRNNENLRGLIANASGHYRLFVVSIEDKGVDEYAQKYGINIPILTGVTDAIKKEYILGATPQTIVIGTDGVVRNDWVGAYQEVVLNEITAVLGVKLPGVLMPLEDVKAGEK